MTSAERVRLWLSANVRIWQLCNVTVHSKSHKWDRTAQKIKATKVIQSRAASDFLFAFCCLTNIYDTDSLLGGCHFKIECTDPIY